VNRIGGWVGLALLLVVVAATVYTLIVVVVNAWASTLLRDVDNLGGIPAWTVRRLRPQFRSAMHDQELAGVLVPATPQHPWPTQLTLGWGGARDKVDIVLAEPTVTVEVLADAARDGHRWRHVTRYVRLRVEVWSRRLGGCSLPCCWVEACRVSRSPRGWCRSLARGGIGQRDA
jgi:hypothetical protein